MEENLKIVCDNTIQNYRYAVNNLRYDGDYINHFSALINGCYKTDIPYEKVKEIRTYLKKNTSKMSVFRGDILYIVSFLIALIDKNITETCDRVLKVFDLLLQEGFKECEHSVLVAHSIVRYCTEDEELIIIKRTKHIFDIMKKKYGNLTKEDDYLLCTFLSLNGSTFECMTEYMDYIFNYVHDLKLFSDNGVQCLTNSILLNTNENTVNSVTKLLFELQKNDVKIGRQFLQLLGVMVRNQNIDESIKEIKEVIEYLCNEESEYSFYIDKDFRNMIAFVITFTNIQDENVKYVDELLAFGTYSFIVSKNQGILNEVLA